MPKKNKKRNKTRSKQVSNDTSNVAPLQSTTKPFVKGEDCNDITKTTSTHNSDNTSNSNNNYKIIRIGSYNVLAESYCRGSRGWSKKETITSALLLYRLPVISSSLLSTRLSIFCLQECDFHEQLVERLNKTTDQYDSVFVKKDGELLDGCATFWNKNEYRLVEQKKISYNSLIKHHKELQVSDCYHLFTNHIASFVVLESIFDINSNSKSANNNADNNKKDDDNEQANNIEIENELNSVVPNKQQSERDGNGDGNGDNNDATLTVNIKKQEQQVPISNSNVNDTTSSSNTNNTSSRINTYANLLCKPNKRYIIVCNTHIFWNPRKAAVKLAQVRMFLNEAQKLKEKYDNSIEENKHHYKCVGKQCNKQLPVVHLFICGDFNSLPYSDVYKYLFFRKLPKDIYNTDITSANQNNTSNGDNKGDNISTNDTDGTTQKTKKGTYSSKLSKYFKDKTCLDDLIGKDIHSLALNSAYSHYEERGEDTQFVTNFKAKFRACLDYIAFCSNTNSNTTCETVKCTKVLKLPTAATLHPLNSLPNTSFEYGSDHLLIAAEFNFTSNDTDQL